MVSKKKDTNNQYQLDRISSMGQVAAGIAHEVKNPLTTVKGFLQLFQEKYDDDYTQVALSELDSALAILGNLLQVTKPEMDDEVIQEINIASELESILNLFLDRQYQVDIIKEFRDTNITIYGKRNQLKRAFFNLLKNAFEAIPDKGMIRIQHYLEEGHLVVTIEDTGIGISEDKIALLGTPFFSTKDDGTGMGLSQVYSSIYQFGGRIHVESILEQGTKFFIFIPIRKQGVSLLNTIDVVADPNQSLEDFVKENLEKIHDQLLQEDYEISSRLKEIEEISDISLKKNVFDLIKLVFKNSPHELITFAKGEGKKWAKHSLQLNLKLEWLQSLRKVLWDFVYNFYRVSNQELSREDFFQIERKVNYSLDTFIKQFSISYNQFKDEILRTQREMVEDLSVPIIPLTKTVSILPLIGTIDTFRANTVNEKVLRQIEVLQIETIIIDLSGVTFLDSAVLNHLFKLFDGIELMGCKAVLTGIRSEIAGSMLKMGLTINNNVIKKGNLQQALESLGFKK
ncbi:MAG: ATP-binding protein [Bacillota bacterium]|nr:ATP-binding protein [Bacillota bacterium]